MANRVHFSNSSSQEPPAVGECQCGCEKKTRLAPCTSRKKNWAKGEPLRYLRGHNRRKRLRYVVVPTGYETDCWLWQLAKTAGGYGMVRIAPGKMALAHRVYYEQHLRPIPDGLELDHLCRVRACVNPEHLEAVSRAENVRRGSKTKLTPADVAAIKRSSVPQRVIARLYGITQGHVSRIRARKVWRDLPDPAS
jgi:hypothetical protein